MSLVMRLLVLLGLLLASAAVPAASSPRVLVLGDSLSAAHNIAPEQGWVGLLEHKLGQRFPGAQVINASISGETSSGGRARIEALLAAHRPTVLVLELGANDALRGLPISQTRANLEQILQLAAASGARLLLAGIELPVNYGRRYRDGLRTMYAELAQQHGTAFVPHLLVALGSGTEAFQDDGLHPTAAAQPKLLDTVWQVLEPLLDGAKAP